MSARIYYFTGTGGSLHVAGIIGRKLEGELIPIMKVKSDEADKPHDVIGFVFPVNYMKPPRILTETIKEMDLSQTTYIFAAATSGGDAGNALYELDRLLRDKGKGLDYGLEIKLGDNSVVVKNKPDVLKRRFEEMEKLAEKMIRAVQAGDTNTESFSNQLKARCISFVIKSALEGYYQINDKGVMEEKCTHCGLCAQVCPADNIRVSQDKVEWENKCVDCFACINWCPRKAIRFGKIDMSKRDQYRFPGITAAELNKYK